jgi:Protein of unknown function (DUF1566)
VRRFVRIFMLPLAMAVFLGGFSCIAGDDDDNDPGEPYAIADWEWTDPETGLIWQANHLSGFVNWMDARVYCERLNFAGRGNWRLPTISELRTLIRGCPGTETGGLCGVTDVCRGNSCQNDFCYFCEHGDGPNDGCFATPELPSGCEHYWSSTVVNDSSERAWAVGFASGFIYKPRVYYAFHARCVR